jgi:hypothetical protein
VRVAAVLAAAATTPADARGAFAAATPVRVAGETTMPRAIRARAARAARAAGAVGEGAVAAAAAVAGTAAADAKGAISATVT